MMGTQKWVPTFLFLSTDSDIVNGSLELVQLHIHSVFATTTTSGRVILVDEVDDPAVEPLDHVLGGTLEHLAVLQDIDHQPVRNIDVCQQAGAENDDVNRAQDINVLIHGAHLRSV